MKKLSLVIIALGFLFLTACSKSGSNATPVATTAACTTNGVYNPTGGYYPYGSQYPYGVPATTGCAGVPGGYNPATQYGYGATAYGSNPCSVYNNGYQVWNITYYNGSYVCISNF